MQKLTFLLFIFYFGLINAKAQSVERIVFEGLTKTDPQYLSALIDTKTGSLYDSLTVTKDVQYLKNLNLFFSVDYEKKIIESGNYEIIFLIEEAVYLYPILVVSGFKDQLKLQIGCNQINFLGRAQSIGFLYQYYDRHSVSFFYNAPRHANRKTGHELALATYSTIEPLYFPDTVSQFNFDNYSASLGGFYWVSKKIRFGMGGAYMWEKYKQIDDADIGLQKASFTFNKYQLRLKADYLAINEHFEFMKGFSSSLFAETIQTSGYPEASFFKVTNELKRFVRLGKKGNLAFRNRLGISTNNNSPFAPFVFDSFVNIRGIGNRVARGTAEFILNAEYRLSVFQNKYLILQLTTFTDYGALRTPGSSLQTMLNGSKSNFFIGGGLRLHSRLIYKTIFRLDYSSNPVNLNKGGFTFGLGQYF